MKFIDTNDIWEKWRYLKLTKCQMLDAYYSKIKLTCLKLCIEQLLAQPNQNHLAAKLEHGSLHFHFFKNHKKLVFLWMISFRMGEVPSPKKVINPPWTLKKPICKGEPYRFSGLWDPSLHTHTHTHSHKEILWQTERHPVTFYTRIIKF